MLKKRLGNKSKKIIQTTLIALLTLFGYLSTLSESYGYVGIADFLGHDSRTDHIVQVIIILAVYAVFLVFAISDKPKGSGLTITFMVLAALYLLFYCGYCFALWDLFVPPSPIDTLH